MSGAPIMIGTNQLPNPPIIAGMTMKNTMIRPWAVTSTFQKCSASSNDRLAAPWKHSMPSRWRYWMPGSRELHPHHVRKSRRR